MNRLIGNVIALFGFVGFCVATAWWYAFFHEALGDNFQIARECFYWTTEACALKSVVTFFVDVPQYDPRLLWVSTTLFFVGAIIRVLKPSLR